MIIINRKDFKSVSYFCLTLLSTMLPSDTEAAAPHIRDGFGRSLIRRKPESFLETAGPLKIPQEQCLDIVHKLRYRRKGNQKELEPPSADNHQ